MASFLYYDENVIFNLWINGTFYIIVTISICEGLTNKKKIRPWRVNPLKSDSDGILFWEAGVNLILLKM